jgi:hypothetical protein
MRKQNATEHARDRIKNLARMDFRIFQQYNTILSALSAISRYRPLLDL